jgi:tetratricopeptide (TPR) repeat protein
MNLNNLEEVKKEFGRFHDLFESGEKKQAAEMLKELLNSLEGLTTVRRAGNIDKQGTISLNDGHNDGGDIYISLNHVMEYYIFAYYYKPVADVKCTDVPYGEYYRAYGDLCIELEKYNAAEAAYNNAVKWNPVDLDAILGIAESCKYRNKLSEYFHLTKQAYRYCCTRATMARYYRNMGFYFLSTYKPEVARACYIYSNIYYHTENADSELAYLETALKDETPKMEIREMQKIFAENEIEPGPNPDTIGVIYQVGKLMMNDGANKLAKDCFSIVYDITQEKELEELLNEL